MWSRVCAVVVERERYPEYVLHPWFDEHGAGETGRRWTVNKRKFWDKIDIVPCTCEMVSISIYWTTCSASLMTTRRQIECNASNCIHKHFYRTSNPWSFIVLDTKKNLDLLWMTSLHDQMAAPGKVKRSNDLPKGVERLKEEHKKVRSNVYFEYHQCIPADINLMHVNYHQHQYICYLFMVFLQYSRIDSFHFLESSLCITCCCWLADCFVTCVFWYFAKNACTYFHAVYLNNVNSKLSYTYGS